MTDARPYVGASAKYVHVSRAQGAPRRRPHPRPQRSRGADDPRVHARARPRATSRRCCAARSRTPSRTRTCAGTATTSYVSAAYVDEGLTLKRWRARARGRVNQIFKRTCHITIKLEQLEASRQASQPQAPARSRARTRRRGGAAGGEAEDAEEEGGRPPNGSESSSRRPAGRRHPRLEVELDGRQEGVRGRAARGLKIREHILKKLSHAGLVRHPDPQGQAADHDRHLHGAARDRDRQVGRRGRRAAQRGARASPRRTCTSTSTRSSAPSSTRSSSRSRSQSSSRTASRSGAR